MNCISVNKKRHSLKSSSNSKSLHGPALLPILLTLAISFSSFACSKAKFSTINIDAPVTTANHPTAPESNQSVPGETPPGETPPGENPPGENPPGGEEPPKDFEEVCDAISVTQPEEPAPIDVDILFVVDSSGSMNAERNEIALQIGNFVGGLGTNANYNMAVMLGHGSQSNHYGKLYNSGRNYPGWTEPTVLKSSEHTSGDFVQALLSKFILAPSDNASDGGEEGLASLYKGITDSQLLAQSKNNDFFREEADLIVVFVSDENDLCATFPEGVTRVDDPDHVEPTPEKSTIDYPNTRFAAADCIGVSPQSVLTALNVLKGEKSVVVTGIIYTGENTVPAVGENEIGYGYTDIISLANGTAVDLAGFGPEPSTSTTIYEGLTSLGLFAQQQLELITEIQLPFVDIISIDLKVDDVGATYNYVEDLFLLQLQDPGEYGSNIEVNFCYKDYPSDSFFTSGKATKKKKTKKKKKAHK